MYTSIYAPGGRKGTVRDLSFDPLRDVDRLMRKSAKVNKRGQGIANCTRTCEAAASCTLSTPVDLPPSSSSSSCKKPGSRSLSPSSVASSSGSPSPYSFLRRPNFLLEEVKDEDDDAAAAAVAVLRGTRRGMCEPPGCEPDERLAEGVVEALALDWCRCREGSWRA